MPKQKPQTAAPTIVKDETPAASGAVYVATTSGSCEIDGEPLIFVKNVTRVRAGHPLLDSVPDYFAPVDETVHYDLESAVDEQRDA